MQFISKNETAKTLLSNSRDFDSKKKLNRSNKIIESSLIDEIDSGITLERLDEMAKDVPIFKYGGQITIHGEFPELTGRVFGYKSIFQNKNKSLGVKWVAIDEEKRKEIASSLRFIGINYRRNSSDAVFWVQKRLTDEVKKDMLGLYSKIDESLFYGNKRIFTLNYYGVDYITLEFTINAIKKENVKPFLDSLGVDEGFIAKEIERETNERKAFEDELNKKDAERKIRKDAAEIEVSKIEAELSEKYEKETLKNGKYIKPRIDYDGKIYFACFSVKPSEGRKRARVSFETVKTLETALVYDQFYSDKVLKNKIEAFKIA